MNKKTIEIIKNTECRLIAGEYWKSYILRKKYANYHISQGVLTISIMMNHGSAGGWGGDLQAGGGERARGWSRALQARGELQKGAWQQAMEGNLREELQKGGTVGRELQEGSSNLLG